MKRKPELVIVLLGPDKWTTMFSALVLNWSVSFVRFRSLLAFSCLLSFQHFFQYPIRYYFLELPHDQTWYYLHQSSFGSLLIFFSHFNWLCSKKLLWTETNKQISHCSLILLNLPLSWYLSSQNAHWIIFGRSELNYLASSGPSRS